MAKSVASRCIVSRAYTAADTNTVSVAIEIPVGGFVPPRGVSVVVSTLLDGGTPLIDVGDADNADGWVAQTDVTATTAGTYSGTAANTAAYADTGRHYPNGGQITVTLSASLTAGRFHVVAQVLDLGTLI